MTTIFVPIYDSDRIVEMEDWCELKFGRRGLTWDSSYASDSDFDSDMNFHFNDSKDATLFSLRWL